MEIKVPDLDDIIWAAETFESFHYNSAYLTVLRREAFLKMLRHKPQSLAVNEVRDILVQFLNDWGCRLRNYDDVTASNLKKCIIDVHPELSAIQDLSILEFDFENISNRERIENIFNKFWHYGSQITKNFGPTATSKTLHIINPKLFAMWDDIIRTYYWTQDRNIIDTGRGYCFFLAEFKKIASKLTTEYSERFNSTDIALWLSKQLNIKPPLTITKFIDEYNYIVYTKNLKRPKDWTPSF